MVKRRVEWFRRVCAQGSGPPAQTAIWVIRGWSRWGERYFGTASTRLGYSHFPAAIRRWAGGPGAKRLTC